MVRPIVTRSTPVCRIPCALLLRCLKIQVKDYVRERRRRGQEMFVPLSHPPGQPSPPCRDRERHPRPQVRPRAQPPAIGTLSRQWCLVSGPGHGPQSDTTGQRASAWASRQQPPRTAAGGSSPWPDASPARRAASLCIFPSAGRRKTSSVLLSPDCVPCHSLPDAGACRPPHYLAASRIRVGLVPECLLLRTVRNHLRVAVAPRTRSNLAGSKPCSLIPAPLIPGLTGTASSPRWIRG